MELNLVADQVIKGRIYPALAQHQARPYTQSWREFGQHWPYTVPLRLQEYCDQHGVKINIHSINSYPQGSYYPIGLGFFDFGIDYFGLLPPAVFADVFNGTLKILFYYHEGDNPFHIQERLDSLCAVYKLDSDCYRFVSGNTAAKHIPGFVYFCDFELWYWQRNRHTPALPIHSDHRSREFTCLNRLHKTWRATAMSDLRRQGVLDNAYWSYCETGAIEDRDNPIQIDQFEQLRYDTEKFLSGGPYECDTLSQEQRNDHSVIEAKYFTDSYCNIVLETHFDADASGGVFVTEKTFKPIKHGQLFYIVGTAGTLELLQELGYRTFDHLFDTNYDRIENHTQRWQYLVDSLILAQRRMDERYQAALADLAHNQQLFLANKAQRLNSLFESIHEQS